MRFLAENELEVLLKAIRMAGKDKLKSVEINMEDLLIMAEHIEDLEGNLDSYDDLVFDNNVLIEENKRLEYINKDLLRKNIQATINALDRPIKLDVFA